MSFPYSYTNLPLSYPTSGDVFNIFSFYGITTTAAGLSTIVNQKLAGLIGKVQRETGRCFEQITGLRYFDGSGTGELSVDEYIPGTVSQVQFLGFFITGDLINVVFYNEIYQQNSPPDRIGIYQSSYPAFAPVYINKFPIGRRNIAVTATWGYTPDWNDLWVAMRDQVAYEVLDMLTIPITNGFPQPLVEEWKDDDIIYKYGLNMLPSKVQETEKNLKQAIKNHKRIPMRFRTSGQRMI